MKTSRMEKPYCDKDFIQIFESSGFTNIPYYLTTHGLVMEAITELFVQSYDGVLHIFPALLDSIKNSQSEVVFERIATPLGLIVSGRYQKGEFEIRIENKTATKLKIKISGSKKSCFVFGSDKTLLAKAITNEIFCVTLIEGETYRISSAL